MEDYASSQKSKPDRLHGPIRFCPCGHCNMVQPSTERHTDIHPRLTYGVKVIAVGWNRNGKRSLRNIYR